MNIHSKYDIEYVVGIDEAGRGPLAGPVSIGVVAIPLSMYKEVIKYFKEIGAKDSKLISPKKREEIFSNIKEYSNSKKIIFTKIFVHSKMIDKIGISKAIHKSIKKGLINIKVKPERAFVYLDGSLSAPAEYNQITVIKGDRKVPIISIASIVAKVTRDSFMCKISSKYPKYLFDIHKGYGTKRHIDLIKKYGLSEIHRKSYCKNFYKI